MSDDFGALAQIIAAQADPLDVSRDGAALAALIEAALREAHAAGVAEERERIHARLRGPSRAFKPRDEYEETTRSVLPPEAP